MRRVHLAGVATAVVFAAAPGAHAGLPVGDGRGGFHLKRVAGFDQPLYVHGPRGAGKFTYVVEREGRVRILAGGRKRKGSFLDIRNMVSCCEGERGLFSIAFRNWKRSRRFFVYFTDNRGDLRVEQFRFRRGTRLKAAEGNHRTVLDISHRRFSNHNGGQLQFGNRGNLLYVATGDGGGGGGKAQKKGSLLGKLLRINPRRGPNRPYRVPSSNPYFGERGNDAIYARGLRNPWRFSFDGSHIAIGDVGQDRREEVDFETTKKARGARGANFGWNVFEGTLRYTSGSIAHHDRPIHQYDHGGGRCSITGGYVSRDRRIRSLYGRYVYGDLCTGKIRSFRPRTGGSRGDKPLGVDEKPGLTTFGEDDRNRLYVAQQSGAVFRIVPNR